LLLRRKKEAERTSVKRERETDEELLLRRKKEADKKRHSGTKHF
jgi:hypothetical protein